MVELVDKVIVLYEELNKNLYVLKLIFYYECKMYFEMVVVVEDFVRIFFQEKIWWLCFGFFYILVEDYKKGFLMLEFVYMQGYLEKELEIKMFVQFY